MAPFFPHTSFKIPHYVLISTGNSLRLPADIRAGNWKPEVSLSIMAGRRRGVDRYTPHSRKHDVTPLMNVTQQFWFSSLLIIIYLAPLRQRVVESGSIQKQRGKTIQLLQNQVQIQLKKETLPRVMKPKLSLRFWIKSMIHQQNHH